MMRMLKAIKKAWQEKCYCRPVGWRKKALRFENDNLFEVGFYVYFGDHNPAPIPSVLECLGEWETLTDKQLEQEVTPPPPEYQGAM